jgi:prevent-host-death family protein
MAAVSVRDLKNRLSEHLRRVQTGVSMLVTDRGRPIAELVPLRPESLTLDQRLAQLAEAGEITLPRGERKRKSIRPARVRGRSVAETLLEDRR